MSLNRTTTALILGALLAAPFALTAPAISAEPASRAECRLMDPQNLTDFCRKMHEIDQWRLQIMDATGPTEQGPAPVLILPPVLPVVPVVII